MRTTVIILMAVVIGLVVGGLAFVAYGNLAGAAIAGLGALGGVVLAAHTLVR